MERSSYRLGQELLSEMRRYVINVELFRYAVAKALTINATDMECLSFLFHCNMATPSELAQRTRLGSGATTAMLDRLEAKGLIERLPNPQDRRGVHITITKETLTRIRPMFIAIEKAEQELVSGYSEKELESLVGFMAQAKTIWAEQAEQLLAVRTVSVND